MPPKHELQLEKYLESGVTALEPVADEELISTYDTARDASIQREGKAFYPQIRQIYGTAFEREKDRREMAAAARTVEGSEPQAFYEEARERPCTWWLEHQLLAKHSLRSCMSCGMCTSLCPASALYEEYNPRLVVEVALSKDEARLEALLSEDTLWLCGQCGSCKPRCTRRNDIMGLVSSLRVLSQLKGFHVRSVRGRQQYAARHLWGGNFWNRGCSLYFRNVDPATHQDFGERHTRYREDIVSQMFRVGASPDSDGLYGGRKIHPDTLSQLRACVAEGGTLALWEAIEAHARRDAEDLGLDLDAYHKRVGSEG